jgi:hypothetical protein
MSKPIDRIRAKITRAKQHINDFQLALGAFYDTRPYGIGVKVDADTGKRIYYVSNVAQIPASLDAVAADVIQNLRTPLDHIAYQLVMDARGSAKPDWKVYYPISRTATDYQATRKGQIKGVRQEVIDAIDATEPFSGGRGHALWQLNELNKPDKHELLIATGNFSGGVSLRALTAPHLRKSGFPDELLDAFFGSNPVFVREAQRRPLQVGDEILIESPPLRPEVADASTFAFHVSFHAPGIVEPEPAIKTVQDMANLVDDIVTTLGKLLA